MDSVEGLGPGECLVLKVFESCLARDGLGGFQSEDFSFGTTQAPSSTRGPWKWIQSEIGLEIRKSTSVSWGAQILKGFHEWSMKTKGSRTWEGNLLGSSVQPLLVVPITAAGLQGEQPLADRTM